SADEGRSSNGIEGDRECPPDSLCGVCCSSPFERSDVPDTKAAFDLPAYLSRIGEPQPAGADMAALNALHRAHLAAIPFENLDIQMGLPIDLDPASLQNALVRRRRGGYCFQQNALFRLALDSLGFATRPLEARVRWNAGGATRPRTHMVLSVVVDGT